MNTKQAEIWKKENHIFSEEERMIRQKIWNVNKQHENYLKEQMTKSKKGEKKVTMNREEYLINRKLIEDIESKAKVKTPITQPK